MTGRIVLVNFDSDKYAKLLKAELPNVPIEIYEDEKQAGAALDDAEVLLALGRWMTPEILARMKKLKWFGCTITGTDHIAPLLKGRKDVILTNGRGMHGPQMTEMILLHMLNLSRGGIGHVRNKDKHAWEKQQSIIVNRKTAVIVGLGAIADYCARVLKALGMTVMGVSNTPRDLPNFDKVWPRTQLVDAAAVADYLIIIAPYTPENDKMINAEVLRAMKPSAYLINVARGGVVDEDALIGALREKRIAGAGLDVFKVQPLPASSPLWDFDNVFITPQGGGMSDQYAADAVKTFLAPNLKAYLAGKTEQMVNIVEH